VFNSRSGSFTPKSVPSTDFIRGWVGPRAILKHMASRRNNGLCYNPSQSGSAISECHTHANNQITEKGNRNVRWFPIEPEQPIIACSSYQVSFESFNRFVSYCSGAITFMNHSVISYYSHSDDLLSIKIVIYVRTILLRKRAGYVSNYVTLWAVFKVT
jgi:hypothetical protein